MQIRADFNYTLPIGGWHIEMNYNLHAVLRLLPLSPNQNLPKGKMARVKMSKSSFAMTLTFAYFRRKTVTFPEFRQGFAVLEKWRKSQHCSHGWSHTRTLVFFPSATKKQNSTKTSLKTSSSQFDARTLDNLK
jgi:hypothetical protein